MRGKHGEGDLGGRLGPGGFSETSLCSLGHILIPVSSLIGVMEIVEVYPEDIRNGSNGGPLSASQGLQG